MKQIFITILFFAITFSSNAQLEVYPFPSSDPEIISEQYAVRARVLNEDGIQGSWHEITSLNVVPREPYEHPICGEQSSAFNITGDRITSFAPFAFSGPIEIEVTKLFGELATRVEITPKAYNINPHYFDGQVVRFAIKEWGYISVNFMSADNRDSDGAGGTHIKHGLMLFADNPESEAGYDIPLPTDQGVVVWNNDTDIETIRNADIIYFPAGDHKMKEHKDNRQEFLTNPDDMEASPLYHGQLRLNKSQKIYLAPGAYVRGCFNGRGHENVWIYGRGVISGRDHLFHEILIPEFDNEGNWVHRTATKEAFVDLIGCDDIRMDGVCIIEPFHHTCPSGKRGLIKNIKILGFNYNNDGVRPGDGTVVDEIFIKTMDDYDYTRGNHMFKNSVIWPMFNGSVGMISWSSLGGQGWWFQNNHIINSETKNRYSNNDGVVGSQADFGIQTHNIELKNIHIDHPITNLVDAQILDEGTSTNYDTWFRDFRFINIKADYPFQRTNGEVQLNRLKGLKRDNRIAWVENFTFTNFVVDGTLVTFDNYKNYFSLNLQGSNEVNTDVDKYVRNITFNTSGELYKINVVCGEGGQCFPRGNAGLIDCPGGTSQTVSFQPLEGFKIKEVKVDGQSVGRKQMLLFEDVQQNHTIEVTFAEGDDYFDMPIDSTLLSTITSAKTGPQIGKTMKVYPNPSDSFVKISGLEGKGQLRLYDISGKLIRAINYSTSFILINLSDYEKGIYFMQAKSGIQMQVCKVIVN
ncbi:T9SS type A sorting domain-containing protein [Draconibacterium sp.]|uniref:T9SS type A sorting domain-containing protein n=1 Tax=Draconibacterium sp. TaxID=1965318 RepID=UPI0035680425